MREILEEIDHHDSVSLVSTSGTMYGSHFKAAWAR